MPRAAPAIDRDDPLGARRAAPRTAIIVLSTVIAVAAAGAGALGFVSLADANVSGGAGDLMRRADGSWLEPFSKEIGQGDVRTSGTIPGYEQVRAYPDGLGNGKYQPSSVNSVEDGNLTWNLPGGGIGSSVTIGPSSVGGEWSVRMRTDLIAGMHIADMRWPDNNVWPGTDGSGGEIDFPEADTSSAYPYVAVVGAKGERRNGKQLFRPLTTTYVPEPWTAWHTYTTQVVAGKSVTVYQDGVRIARVTQNVPRTKIHEQFQVEPIKKGKGGAGTVEVSAVAFSPKLDLSTVKAVESERLPSGSKHLSAPRPSDGVLRRPAGAAVLSRAVRSRGRAARRI